MHALLFVVVHLIFLSTVLNVLLRLSLHSYATVRSLAQGVAGVVLEFSSTAGHGPLPLPAGLVPGADADHAAVVARVLGSAPAAATGGVAAAATGSAAAATGSAAPATGSAAATTGSAAAATGSAAATTGSAAGTTGSAAAATGSAAGTTGAGGAAASGDTTVPLAPPETLTLCTDLLRLGSTDTPDSACVATGAVHLLSMRPLMRQALGGWSGVDAVVRGLGIVGGTDGSLLFFRFVFCFCCV
jgi:hypothetical protein